MSRNRDPFVNFALVEDVNEAENDGIIHSNTPEDSEYEESHISELERRAKAFDEVEKYVVIRMLVKDHEEFLTKVLNYIIHKKGEMNK